jgi:hypothetical protein
VERDLRSLAERLANADEDELEEEGEGDAKPAKPKKRKRPSAVKDSDKKKTPKAAPKKVSCFFSLPTF